MHPDEQGFLYPQIDLDKCIDCHLCEKVCPVLNQATPKSPLQTYAAKNKNPEVQQTSSSGGVFFALAEYIINEKKGVVFGARFNDNWDVVHEYAETIEAVKAFKGSKYVQSQIGDSFIKARKFLNEGRTVMFTGTPCQIAGLKLFLRKDYGQNLLCVDFVCHGVPSPMIWQDYLNTITRPSGAEVGKNSDLQSTLNTTMPVITGISFRDKKISWQKYGFAVHAVAHKGDKNTDLQSLKTNNEEQELLFEPHYENLYMQGFLKDLYLRPSCYACPAKSGKSHSDITIADFWGLKHTYPDAYNNELFSLVMALSSFGKDILTKTDISYREASYKLALKYNKAIVLSTTKPKQYDLFWEKYLTKGFSSLPEILLTFRPSTFQNILTKIKSLIKKILNRDK